MELQDLYKEIENIKQKGNEFIALFFDIMISFRLHVVTLYIICLAIVVWVYVRA